MIMPSAPTPASQRRPLGNASAPSQGVLSPAHEAKVSQLRKHNLVSNSPFHKHKLSSSDLSPTRLQGPRARPPPSSFRSPLSTLDGQLEIDPHRIPDEQEFENFQQVKARYNAPRKSKGYKKLEGASCVSSSPFKSVQTDVVSQSPATRDNSTPTLTPPGTTKQPSRLAGLELTTSSHTPAPPQAEPKPVFSLSPTVATPGRQWATPASWKDLVRRAHVAPTGPIQSVSTRLMSSSQTSESTTESGKDIPRRPDVVKSNHESRSTLANPHPHNPPPSLDLVSLLPDSSTKARGPACTQSENPHFSQDEDVEVEVSRETSCVPGGPQDSSRPFEESRINAIISYAQAQGSPPFEPRTPLAERHNQQHAPRSHPPLQQVASGQYADASSDTLTASCSSDEHPVHHTSYSIEEETFDLPVSGCLNREGSLAQDGAQMSIVGLSELNNSAMEDADEDPDAMAAEHIQAAQASAASMTGTVFPTLQQSGWHAREPARHSPSISSIALPSAEASAMQTYLEDRTCIELDVESPDDSGCDRTDLSRPPTRSVSQSMGEMSRVEEAACLSSPASDILTERELSIHDDDEGERGPNLDGTATYWDLPDNESAAGPTARNTPDEMAEKSSASANSEEDDGAHLLSKSRQAPRLSTGLTGMGTGLGLGLDWVVPDELNTIDEAPAYPTPVVPPLGPRLCTPGEQAEEIIRRRRMKRGLRAQTRTSDSSEGVSQDINDDVRQELDSVPADSSGEELEALESACGAWPSEHDDFADELGGHHGVSSKAMGTEPAIKTTDQVIQSSASVDCSASEHQLKYELSPGTGKVYVRVDSFTPPSDLPIPSQPTRFELLLNNGLEEVKARSEGRLVRGQAQAFMGQEFQLRQHKGLEFTLTLRVIKDAHLYPRAPSAATTPTTQPESPRKKEKLMSRIFGSPKKVKAKPLEPAHAPAVKSTPHDLTRFLNREGDLARVHVAFDSLADQMLGKVMALDLPMVEVLDPSLSLSESWTAGGAQSVDPLPPSRLHRARGTLQVSMFFLPPVGGQLPTRLVECVEGMSSVQRERMEATGPSGPEWARHTLDVLDGYEQGAVSLGTILSPPRRYITLSN